MPIVLGLGGDAEWNDPLNLYGGKTPAIGLGGDQASSGAKTSRLPGLSDRDYSDLVDTVIAEAAGEGDQGMAAVASVIRNRASERGKSAGDIVREPHQFTGYANPGDDVRRAQQDPTMRARAEAVINGVFTGEVKDPTGGADHYHADSVSPDWARTMPETTRVGRHVFYASSKGKPRNAAEAIASITPEQDPLGLYTGDQPALGDEKKVAEASKAEDGGSILLTKLQAGKPSSYITAMSDDMRSSLTAMFEEAPDFVRKGLDILSGARTPERQAQIIADHAGKYGFSRKAWLADVAELGPVEAGRKWRPAFRELGLTKNIGMPGGSRHQHGTAADLGWSGGAFSTAPREVREWVHANAGRYGLTFPMGHEPWHIETVGARSNSAGDQQVAAQQAEQPRAVAMDGNFIASDPLGLYSGQDNPLQVQATADAEQRRAEEERAKAEAERQRVEAETTSANDAAGQRQEQLEAENPGRYQLIDEGKLPEWQKQWEDENRSSGLIGDTKRILKTGVAGVGRSLGALADVIFENVPGGETFLEASDDIDRWLIGKPLDQRLTDTQERASASVTERQSDADAKNWWDSERGTFGPAWRDPRSYLRAVGESAPGTVITMLPGGVLARGSYLASIASGASQRVAAAAAARTATIAGAISEGMLGGADASTAVRDKIASLPPEIVSQSDAVKTLVGEGMSEADAIKAVTTDAATQAFLIAGTATGAFGGVGDRALAKILAEGVGGTVAQRIVRGGVRGAVAEGLLEEAPQGAAQTIAQNKAVQTVDPSQDLTEGVGEAVASGIAAGGAMGAGMGAAGGAARPSAEQEHETQPRRGPLRSAVDHGAEREAERSPVLATPEATAKATAEVPADGRPEIGATVRVDAEGMEPFMARIDGYEGDEPIIIDSRSGEIYQVPLDTVTKIASAAGTEPLKRTDPLPEQSDDPALEPQDPVAGTMTTEAAPASEDVPLTDRWAGRPKAGDRVTIDTPETGRKTVRIETYEEDGREAVVVDEDGNALQVPVDRLRVNGLTPAQVEAQDLKRNPPIEREIGDAGPNSRRIRDKTMVFPDENHAHLYDLAREQAIAKRLGGTSQVDMNSVLPAERKRLADAFGIAVEDLASMADDYRYRAERAAKEARSTLPQKLPAVNERLLKQRQAARAKLEGTAPATDSKDADAHWWDVELTQIGRRDILGAAGVKRPDKVMWKSLTPGVRAKLTSVRDMRRAAEETVAEIGTVTDAAAHEAATSPSNDLPEPSQAQKEAGNYKVGRLRLGGLDISIENPAGSERKGVSASGKAWAVKMKSHYGYIRGTVGRDKDHIDVFVKPGTEAIDDTDPIYVVDQRDPARGRFDEHKVMAGFSSEEEARAAYLENYTKGWTGLGSITPTTMAEFKAWLQSGKTAEPFAPKWFASREKADAHIAKGKLGDTHHVVQNGKRFEVREKAQAEGNEPANRAPQQTVADIHKEMADRVSPTEFARRVAASRHSMESAVIEPGGKLLVLKATHNPNGDHAEFFGRLYETGQIELTSPGYVRITSSGKQIGASHTEGISTAAAATLRAVQTAAVREGLTFMGEVPATEEMNPPEKESEATSITFQTAKGSTYVVNNDGSTKRDKAFRKEHGEKEQGPQPTSDTTFYVDQAGLDALGEFQTQGSRKAVVVSKGHAAVKYLDGPNAGSIEKRTITKFQTEPAVGLFPVELWREGTRVHFGNAITSVSSGATRDYSQLDLTAPQVREVLRSKEFKQAYAEIAATQMGTPHPESPVGYELARGWLDEKAGRPPTHQEVPHFSGGLDPIEPYYMGYDAARYGKARVIRASNQEAAYQELSQPRPEPPAPRAEKPKTSTKPKLPVTANTVFTDDAAEKARALLRRKLSGNTLNSGIDPELLQAGITLAGYHIEKGARTFAAYAKAMIADLGDSARPYLKSWYMGVKYDPRAAAFDGMSSAAEVESADVDHIEDGNDEPAELDQPRPGALERASAEQVSGTEGGRDARKGADRRGGTDVSGGGSARAERVPTGRGVADGQGDLLAPAAGERTEDGNRREADDASAGRRSQERQPDARRDVASVAKDAAALPAQARPVDYVITDADELGTGGQKAKFAGNVAAIKLLRALDQEKRPATRDEQSVLARWVGWGGLRSAFPREDGSVTKGWEKEAAELKALLSPEEYAAAESSTRNAHYTPPEIVGAVWDIARRLGFRGGQVLEPSIGAGNFLGLMPGDLRGGANVTGVELDRITGGIAKHLYPTANIQTPMGFEKLTVPDGHFDLAIGNPPFGSEKLYDKERRHLNKFSIHNFFFAKSIEATRPGGILAMVVTNRFLDGANATARGHIAKVADLVGAIRLPNNAFLKNAGTEVTTDIVLLRRRQDGDVADTRWTEVGSWKGRDGKSVPLNRYFVDNPDMMLGDFGAFGTMYGPDDPALVARAGSDLSADLARAIRSLPENVMVEPGVVAQETVAVPETVTDVQVGTMFAAPDGGVHVRLPDHLGQPRSEALSFPNETAQERVAGMVRVRDAFAKLRRAQIDERSTDAHVENLRGRLNALYDGFVKKHGPINAEVNKRLFRDDPTWPQISALEHSFDKGVSAAMAKKTGEKAKPASASKATIFTKRTQQPYRRPSSASSAKDALATVLNDYGRVNLDAMAALYRKSPETIVDELGPLLFRTPAGAYETADHYLSGNVKAKLAEAERAAERDPDLRRNVAALRDVIPADIEAVDIDVKPGAPWLPAAHVAEFIGHIAGGPAVKPKAFYSRANARWEIDVPGVTAAASTMYGTDRASVGTVLSAALNGQQITVHDRTSDGKSIVNQAATDAANEKIERVKAEWRRWLWTDDARRDQLARLYNDTFNTDVQRSYDGAHLTLPGKVGDDIISFRPHQKNFVWRTLQSGTALADHTVGAGKTFAAIASAMEKRRIGQARKPLFVVPNHLVGQWAADFVRLYPGAKVLAATKADFEKDRRKRLFARIATGDWDAVIVAHSSFGRMGMDPEYEAKFIAAQMEDLEASIDELRRETGQKSRNVAQLTKWRDNLKAKMERLLDAGKKDDGLTFDELGVDALYVDEAHEFKNLAYSTSMQRVAGLGNMAGSQKAADLFMKSRFILERTGGNNVVFLSGTPVSNTMAEMYTVQRYLDDGALRAMGVSHFDAWARVFGEVVTDWELSPSGQYKLNSRFAKFVNVPELMQRYRAFADVVTNDDIKAQLAAIGKTLPLPKVRGGKPTNLVVDRSSDQAAYIGEGKTDEHGNLVFPKGSLVWRAENLPKKVEKGADNMLKVMSDARKAALDMRLIDADYPDHRGSKVHRAADEMKRIYDKWGSNAGTQLVFIDLSTPKKARAAEEERLRDLMRRAEEGDESAQEALDNMSPDDFLALQSSFSVYDDLREKLIARGVPAGEIAFIHDANTEAQKEELFGKVRSGRVRFLFGSTAKMGAGTNVQNRLVALHHLDAPWRPSDLEQRDGRGIRQGNELYAEDPDGFEIEILRYATKNTLDARQWQTIEAKARFIQQLRKGDLKTREVEDIAGEAANAAEMKAAASGNPLILEEMETRRKLRQLESQSVEHDREQYRIKGRIRSLRDEADQLRQRREAVEKDAALAKAAADAPFSAVVDGTKLDKPKDFGAALASAMRRELIEHSGGGEIGSYAGFSISIDHLHDRAFSVVIGGARQYDVDVRDAADVDATGLAMRVTNTVRRLASIPEADAARAADIETQVPDLEKQIGEWKNAAELDEVSARHRRLLDALRPKAGGNAAGQTADQAAGGIADPPAVANKRPDAPATGSDGKLESLPAPDFAPDRPIRDSAIDLVRTMGEQTGHEYLVAIDDDGTLVEYGTAGHKSSTGMNNKLLAALLNPDRRVAIFHNHPMNGPLSWQDLTNLAFPGIYSVWAVGAGGTQTRAALSPEASRAMGTRENAPDVARQRMDAALHEANRRLRQALQNMIDNGQTSAAEADKALPWALLLAAERAGLVDMWAQNEYDPATLRGLPEAIDEAAGALARSFFNGSEIPLRGVRRPTVTLGHVAELARASGGLRKDAGRRSGAGEFAEGSPQYHSREDRRGREGRAGRRVTESRVVEELRGKLTDLKPSVLKTIPLNYFTELARPNMTAVGDYLRVKRLMDAYRGKKHAEADEIAQEWLKFTRLGFAGKDKAKAQQLADLMHDATLAGVDPSQTDDETKAKGGYAELRKRFMALPPKGRELFETVRSAYRAQALELDEILLDNVRKAQEIAQRRAEDRYRRTLQKIADAGLTGLDRKNAEEDAASAYKAETTKAKWAAKARMTRMRIAFENSRVPAPYFPLGRFGRYFITVRDIGGSMLSFSKHETEAERARAMRELQREFPTAKIETGVMEAGSDLRRAMDPRIVAEIEDILGGAGVSGDIMDQIWQRYLESMPDLSTRKRFIHRKGTAGYARDALRVFSSHMFHAAHQMARVKYGLELQELVDQTVDQAREADDQARAMTLANELSSRHEWVMNPTGGKVAQTMTSTAFVWFLAASPAAAVVNMTQTVMMGAPILGSRFGGIAKAGRALARASRDTISGRGSVLDADLTADEKRAMEAFYDSGLIDRTQSHDLAGVGETGVEYTPVRAKVMGAISWMFHRAEVWNREVTALAAYRMARETGQNWSDAVDIAHDLTWKTHFDYSNSSRPALLQNDFAKVALVFRQHNINMLYRVFRDIHQSFKGDTPAARREARYQLAGVLGMMGLMGGVTGVMGFNLAMALAGMIFGDDDDPFEFEDKFRASVIDILGPELGGVVLNGAPGHYLGVDLTSRIGMPDLWFRSPGRELQGKDEYQYWLSQSLGATVGLGEQVFRGAELIMDGDVARGVEMLAPKAVRDLMKGYRYANEGVTSVGGNEVLPAGEIDYTDLIAQTMGFTPAKVAETWERNSALKNAETRIKDKRQRLVNKWALATMAGDKETAGDVLDAIKAFNAVKLHAGVPITKETLQRSIRTRARNAAKREDGVLIGNKQLGKELRDKLASPVYR